MQRILTLVSALALIAVAAHGAPQFAPRYCATGSTQCGSSCIALGKVCYVAPHLVAPPRCTTGTKVCGETCIAQASTCHRRHR